MSVITINIKPFGSFRKFGKTFDLSVPTGSTIAMIKTALQEKLNGEGLVSDSVLANENRILRDEDIVEANTKLSILPPVCGG